MAVSRRHLPAILPAPSAGRPSEVDKKKFCISIMMSAVREGEMMIGVVVVESLMDSFGEGMGYLGGGGRVRSNTGGDAE